MQGQSINDQIINRVIVLIVLFSRLRVGDAALLFYSPMVCVF